LYQIRLEDLQRSHLLSDTSGTIVLGMFSPSQPTSIVRSIALLRSGFGRLLNPIPQRFIGEWGQWDSRGHETRQISLERPRI
jgi:hypothetical protein